MPKYLLIVLLTGCSIAPIFPDHGVKATDNEPYPILSVTKTTLGRVNKACGTHKDPLREVSSCIIVVDCEDHSKGAYIWCTFDCQNGCDHEEAHANNGTNCGPPGAGHTREMRERIIAGKSLCLK